MRNPEARERRLAYLRNYMQTYSRTDRGREVRRNAQRNYRMHEREKQKLRAREAIKEEIKRGRMVRGACAICGTGKADAHHHLGYQPEHWLDVMWLCPEHHRLAHQLAPQ